MTGTLDDLRMLPQWELHQRAVAGDDAATRVRAGRATAARQLRLLLARMYGRDGMSSTRQWHVLPYLTGAGTVGVVDIARGLAWDSGVPAVPEVADLGLHEAGEAYAAAAMRPGAGGPVSFDGVPVQAEGTTVRDGRTVPPGAPAGWRQILLGGLGYDPARLGPRTVPVAEYGPDTWVRPVLAEAGLTTCYGRPGEVPEPGLDKWGQQRTDPDGRPWLDVAHGWEAAWPHGLPGWVSGTSVTVLDVLADSAGLRRLRLPRGADFLERRRVRVVVDYLRGRGAQGSYAGEAAFTAALAAAEGHLREATPGAPWEAAQALTRDVATHALGLTPASPALTDLWEILAGSTSRPGPAGPKEPK